MTPAGALSEAERDTIRAHKAALLSFLAPAPTREPIPATPQPPIDADEIRHHLDTLLPSIRDGCLRGLASHLDRVPAEIVAAILLRAAPDVDADVTEETCRRAGAAATLAAVIAEYRTRLRWLVELGEDPFRYAAALEMCLIHPTPSADAADACPNCKARPSQDPPYGWCLPCLDAASHDGPCAFGKPIADSPATSDSDDQENVP